MSALWTGNRTTRTDTTDVVYRFCIENQIFDLNVVNELIYEIS